MSDVIVIEYSNWEKIGTDFYGEDRKEWKFKCASCGHIQSINSILSHNPKLESKEVGRTIYCECEGRINEGYGCDWSLYGLFQCHKLVVYDNERKTDFKCFLFENEDAIQKLREKKIKIDNEDKGGCI